MAIVKIVAIYIDFKFSMGNLNTFPIYCPLNDDSGSTQKFMGGLSVQPTTHAAKNLLQQQHVFLGVQQYYLRQQVNTCRPPEMYPMTSSG